MKNFKNLFLMLSFLAAVTFAFSSCSKTASDDEGDTSEAVDGAHDGADGSDAHAADGHADGDHATDGATDGAADGAEGGATEGGSVDAGSFAWSSGLSDWVSTGAGSTSITLDGLGDKETGLTESGKAQLEVIAAILEANPGVSALIKGHSPSKDTKVGEAANKTASKARAVWAKAKLMVGHDAVGSRVSTEGVGSAELLEGVDAKDDSQRRVTVSFSK